jgi:hypothetical protein
MQKGGAKGIKLGSDQWEEGTDMPIGNTTFVSF